MPESTRRSIGDKLILLGAHLNAHPELPVANVDVASRVLTVQLSNDETAGLQAWAATLTDVTWKSADFRTDIKGEPSSHPTWHAYLYGELAQVRMHVWCGISADFAVSAVDVIVKLTESTAAVSA